MAGVAFTALNLAAEKMPDKVWHSIPGGYFKPPDADDDDEEEENRKENSKSRSGNDKPRNRDDTGRSYSHRSRSDRNDDDRDRSQHSNTKQRRDGRSRDKDRDGSDTDDSAHGNFDKDSQRRKGRRSRDEKPQRRPVARRSRNSGYLDRGYESDSGPKQRPEKLRESDYYFPPPPIHSQAVAHYVDPENGEHVFQPTIPYHPAQFDAPPGSRDGYYAGHPKEQQAYTPADIDPETVDDTDSDADYSKNRSMNNVESSRDHTQTPFSQSHREDRTSSRSSQRYTPHDYPNTPAPPGPDPYVSPHPHAYGLPPAAHQYPAYGAAPAGMAYPPAPHAYPMPVPVPAAHFAPSPAQHGLPPYNRYPSPYDSEGNALNDGPTNRSQPRSAPHGSQTRGRPKSQSRARSQSRGRKSRSSSSGDDDGKSDSQSRERSTSRLRREAMAYGKRHADLGTGALGALAGGFIGRNIGNKNDWGVIIGAGLGGLIGAYGERELEKRKAKQARRRQVDSRNNSRVRRDGGERSRSRSRGGRGRDDRRKSRSGYDSH